MLVTSALIPPLAVYHRLAGTLRHRAATPWEAGPGGGHDGGEHVGDRIGGGTA